MANVSRVIILFPPEERGTSLKYHAVLSDGVSHVRLTGSPTMATTNSERTVEVRVFNSPHKYLIIQNHSLNLPSTKHIVTAVVIERNKYSTHRTPITTNSFNTSNLSLVTYSRLSLVAAQNHCAYKYYYNFKRRITCNNIIN